ncbi:hypothetical protein P280DRAFT_238391 [Massarina eburnea CBS 473.64]|uniref:Uncharacterized protein n=1 Tax=Massarina eburnea CBS 473.64 TaxID=1395130 RepID=A0A6A6RJB9_9PLEO|nr:hypothetical protein P280DRAFT_238391 [Massarina eburnea CBS 473.64]
MQTTQRPLAYAFPDGHPSSPPMAPGSRTQPHFPPPMSPTSPIYKRMGLGRLVHSPPFEFIEPIGLGPQFHFTRPTSRASTASGRACATSPRDSEDSSADASDEDSSADESGESDEESEPEEIRPYRRVSEADVTFVLEELGSSDEEYDSDVEVVQPTHYEYAKSEKSEGILEKLKEMQVMEGSSDEEERARIYRRKKKRWSAGIFKRSHSQSIEGDSSYSDNDPLDDVDATARRLRRRVRGPADRRASLVFEDRGFSNSNNIAEVEEPEDGWILHSKGPPSIPSDDAFTLDELPFWEVEEDSETEEAMDVEYDSE